jgi:dTDP-4-amino-4,6-dideoxygalactose transaminase
MTGSTRKPLEQRTPDSDSSREQLQLVRPSLPPLDQYVEQLREIWASGMLSNFSASAQEFERLVSDYTRQQHSLAVVNCDVGLTLAIRALDIPPGQEVILSSFAFNSSANAVIWNRLQPRFVDVDPATYGLDPNAVEDAMSKQTALILGTHVFGVPCDVEALSSLASSSGIAMVFDAAQAFATFVGDRHISSFGDASAFSFSGTKIVTAGEGGVVVMQSEEVASRFRYLRGYGFQDDYVTRVLGLNGKMSELHAALGCLTVARTEDEVDARNALAELYRDLLRPIGGLAYQEVPPGVRPTPTYFSINAGSDRDALAERLAQRGIQTKQYFRPLHLMPFYSSGGHPPLPVAKRLSDSVLCLPLHSTLGDEAVSYVCSEIMQYFTSKEVGA